MQCDLKSQTILGAVPEAHPQHWLLRLCHVGHLLPVSHVGHLQAASVPALVRTQLPLGRQHVTAQIPETLPWGRGGDPEGVVSS